MNGTMEESRKPEGHQMNGISEMTVKEGFSESTSSHIRESSRSFMSSMLSDNFDTRTKELFGMSAPINKTTSSESQEGFMTSPIKPSPDSSKSVSKDSLSPASGSSPQKRSPGAVRVVEFTSQTKSYVKTVISSRTFLQTSSSVDSPFTNISDTSLDMDSRQHPVYSSSSSVSESISSAVNGSVNKSFIQQRVERLYGPGALAQGFFRRTKMLSKFNDEFQEEDASSSSRIRSTPVNSPGLPVLRHLRPEFRAQLPLTTTARRRQDEDNVEAERIVSVEPVMLQTQVSVESVAESLPDMQPAAPEVILPVETTQPILDVPKTPEQEHKPEAGDSSEEKDGHYFLKMLKQEIDRLTSLVAGAEEELNSGENLPEEALGKLRAASGQARLLVKQKLQQFEGLCHKNISRSPQEAFPTTSQDLAGFWDMVKLQIDHVDSLFDELRILRQSNWIEQEPAISSDTVDAGSTSSVGPKRRSASKRTVTKSVATEEQKKASEAARKAREEMRRKVMEERRKAMRQKAATDDIEIYVPQENETIEDSEGLISIELKKALDMSSPDEPRTVGTGNVSLFVSATTPSTCMSLRTPIQTSSSESSVPESGSRPLKAPWNSPITPGGSMSKIRQRRVDRLYSPGALAPGFFRYSREISTVQDDEQEQDKGVQLACLGSLRSRLKQLQDESEGLEEPVSSNPDITSPDMQPAASEVVLPLETAEFSPEQINFSNDGHYYLKLLAQEMERLDSMATPVENELVTLENLSDEIQGKLRVATCKARLLMTQKLQQFHGLCQKNICLSLDEDFPTTNEDLAGFWDMVKLQISDVDEMFEELRVLREANWVENEVKKSNSNVAVPKRRVIKRPVAQPVLTEAQIAAREAASKAREELRRRIIEERRKAMQQKATE